MLLALSIMMFIVPAFFSVIIHNYLRHGELSGKRKLVFFAVYLVLRNGKKHMLKKQHLNVKSAVKRLLAVAIISPRWHLHDTSSKNITSMHSSIMTSS